MSLLAFLESVTHCRLILLHATRIASHTTETTPAISTHNQKHRCVEESSLNSRPRAKRWDEWRKCWEIGGGGFVDLLRFEGLKRPLQPTSEQATAVARK
nr:hypothetical protein Itr_chr14CG04390 [Ipomoea trifida]